MTKVNPNQAVIDGNQTAVASAIKSAAVDLMANKVEVTLTSTTACRTIKSEKLTHDANYINQSQGAETRLLTVPKDFTKVVSRLKNMTFQPFIDNGIKLPDNGRAATYAISTENNLFDDVYKEYEQRNHDRIDGRNGLRYLIEGPTTDSIIPDPASSTSFPCYGGWDKFKEQCFKQIGLEINDSPDAFPYEDIDEFLEGFKCNTKVEVADPTANNTMLTQFAERLAKDTRIGTATRLYQQALNSAHDALDQAREKIDLICPATDWLYVDVSVAGHKFSLRIDEDKLPMTPDINLNDGTGWTPLVINSKPVIFKADFSDNVKALEGLARKYTKHMYNDDADNAKYAKPKRTAQMLQANTFAYMATIATQTDNYFRPGGNELCPEYRELYIVLDRFVKISTVLNNIATGKRSKNKQVRDAEIASRLGIARTKIVQTLTSFEGLLVD